MKRFLRLTAFLMGLTLLLSACGSKAEPELADASTQTAPPVEGVTALELCDGEVTLRFEKDESGTWIWEDDADFPLEQTAMDALLALPAALDGGEAVSDVQELSTYGLESAEKYVTVTSDGEEMTYYIGTQASDGDWYVLTPSGKVVCTSDANKSLLSRSIYAMAVLPDLPTVAEDKLVSVTLVNDAGGTVRITADEDGTRRSGNRDVTSATAALVQEIAALSVSSCVDYDPAEGAAEVCGLVPPAVTLTVVYTAENGAERTLTVAVGGSTEDGGRYVTVGEESTIYRMEESALAQTLTLAETGL